MFKGYSSYSGAHPELGNMGIGGSYISAQAPMVQQRIQQQALPPVIAQLQHNAQMDALAHGIQQPGQMQWQSPASSSYRPYMGPNAVQAARGFSGSPNFGGTQDPRQAALAAYNQPTPYQMPRTGMGGMPTGYGPPPGPGAAANQDAFARGTNPNPHALGGGMIGV